MNTGRDVFGRDEGAKAEAAQAPPESDGLLIIDEGELGTNEVYEPPVSGALGRLWETWHIAADSEVLAGVQNVAPEDGPWRVLGSLSLDSRLLPAPNLSVTASGFVRLAVDGAPSTARPQAVIDVYEVFAKVNVDRATVTLGRLVVPWGSGQAVALGDRLNPPDFRRGAAFPEPARQRQPMWGASMRTSLGSVGLEAVAFAQYEASEGSLAASDQGGARIARYQTALVRSPARVGGLLRGDDTSSLREAPTPFSTATVAARAWRRVGDIDVSASVAFGFDDTPLLRLRPEVARALAGEYVAAHSGIPGASLGEALACDAVRSGLWCVGGPGALVHERTTSMGVDASWGLGVVILRAEALIHPHVAGLGGKSAILVDDLGLRSTRTTQLAGVVGIDGSVGALIDGSVELFDVMWVAVPAEALVWGVEPFSASSSVAARDRDVHRVGAAASLGGELWRERVAWRVRGEAGLNTSDVLVTAQVRYRLPSLGLYVGGRADLFAGAPGTPGWFREDASLVGIFVGEGS